MAQNANIFFQKGDDGRAIAQAIGRRLPTAVAGVIVEFVVDKVALG
jgi:hypothetical protein